jgi:S-adenosylmethionine:tRNA-ribosyltransferase-isomerase (queuine synthetase)
MRVDEFDFHLPEAQIAQHPPEVRGTSRLMVLDRTTGTTTTGTVADLPGWLRRGDAGVSRAAAGASIAGRRAARVPARRGARRR